MNIKRPLSTKYRLCVYVQQIYIYIYWREICLFVTIFENIARGLLLYTFDREV